MKISVVIPAYNEEKLIVASLRSIKEASTAFTEKGWTTELVVANNNSTDRTGELAAAEGATVVFEPINQIGRARNAGAAAATGDWLVFVDADSYPTAALFRATARQIESGKVAAGGSTVRMDARDWGMDFLVSVWNFISRTRKWMAGSYIFCDARAFREIGGFSSHLYVSEELELSKKLKVWARKNGRKIVILTEAPLLSSARKAKLYTKTEYFTLLWHLMLSRGRAVQDPKACAIWYDGRR